MRIAVPDENVPHSLIGVHYAPELGRAAMEFSRVSYVHSRLTLREFEAARIITALISGCRLCQNWRSAVDLPNYLPLLGDAESGSVADRGPVPDEAFYRAIPDWRTSDLLSPRERVAVEFAERTGLEPKVLAEDEAFWARAKSLFSDAELVDLAYCVAVWTGLGRMTHVLGLDSACAVPTPAEQAA